MGNIKLAISDKAIESSLTIVDPIGKIIEQDGRILRIINDEFYADAYRKLLENNQLDSAFSKGLIYTWLPNDIQDSRFPLILEHKKIPFILHPAEYTDLMFWLSAKMFLELNIELFKLGYLLKDAHPWNVTFNNYQPTFFDFCSIVKESSLSKRWLYEFIKYFAIPIYLSKRYKTKRFSKEYRKEHEAGFGNSLLTTKLFKNTVFSDLYRLENQINNPSFVLNKLLNWLEKTSPILPKTGDWGDYNQSHESSFFSPSTPKQRFVYQILSDRRPNTVLDLASNKGFYAGMAAHLGASVIALDNEEVCVNECLLFAKRHGLTITPAEMNIIQPTPEFGWGLTGENSYKRFNSEVVLALGLIHHVCLRQNLPVKLFCKILSNFSSDGIVIEYVAPEDKHVKNWKVKPPNDYSIESIKSYLGNRFPYLVTSPPVTSEGINRTFLFFHK